LKDLLTSGKQPAVARLHIGARQYAAGNGIRDLTTGHDEPPHAVVRMHVRQQLAFAHELKGEGFRQCLVPHGRFPRCLGARRGSAARDGAVAMSATLMELRRWVWPPCLDGSRGVAEQAPHRLLKSIDVVC